MPTIAESIKFFKTAFSVDNVIFGFDNSNLKVLLISRALDPYKDHLALPGDLVYPNEDLETATGRVLTEMTGLNNVYLEQVKTFGAVDRHPLGRVITVAYFSLIKKEDINLVSTSDVAISADWHDVSEVLQGELAFDHKEILKACFNRLKETVRTRPIGFELLPEKFTLTELQQLYESILEKDLDKRNFRKKVLSTGVLRDLGEIQKGVSHRPARLYSFDSGEYEKMLKEGVGFQV